MSNEHISLVCCACESETPAPVLFPCGQHSLCPSCFHQFCLVNLSERRFHLHPQFGYTINCPAKCDDSWLPDSHIFKRLGPEKYDEYKRIAAETVVEGDGLYCPNSKCSTAFLYDSDDVRSIQVVICSECQTTFCTSCRSKQSMCVCKAQTTVESSAEFQSLSLIRSEAKKCPKCSSPTQKTGGCNHISCRCGCHWCWHCQGLWTDDCQWLHWFS